METSADSLGPDTTVADIPAVNDTTEALALLSVSAARDDLGAALAKRPRARIPSLTLLLAVLLVAGLGFLGGELVGKHNAGSGSGVSAAALRSAFAGRAGAGAGATTGAGGTGSGSGRTGGFGGGAFGAGNDTIGSIKLIDGSTVYVETTSGSIVQVSVSPSTKITISSTGTVKNLAPGDEVIVAGTKNSSGNVAATSISQSSLGSAGGAG
jgi:hypothetical protein